MNSGTTNTSLSNIISDDCQMHVLIVCDLPSTFVRFRLPLAKEIARLGHRITIAVSEDEPDYIDKIQETANRVHVIPMNRTGLNPILDYQYFRRLRRLMESDPPDVLFAYQAKAAVYSCLAAKSISNCRRNVLFPGLGFLFAFPRGLKHRFVQLISIWLYKKAFATVDTAFFQNPDDLETLEASKIFTQRVSRRIVNGSGVDIEEFAFSPIPSGEVRFLFAGRLLKEKGILDFVDVARQLRAKYKKQVAFDVIGAVDSNPSSIDPKTVISWRAEGIVNYCGNVPDVRPYLRATSVFVLPSYYMEGTPRSILEAMSVGRPIVTTNSRGCKETVEDGRNGFLVEPRSQKQLFDRLAFFVENQDKLCEFGEASRKLCEEKYDVRKVIQEMVDAMKIGTIS